jgi:TolB-like protein
MGRDRAQPATLGLLRALAPAGNPAEALRLARVHEALVRQELDASPGPEWTAAVDSLRAELARPRVSASLVASSQWIGVADVAPTSATNSSAAHDARRTTTPAAPPSTRHRPQAKLAKLMAAAVLVLAGLASYAWWTRGRLVQGASTASRPGVGVRRGSVAVLPFANTSGDSADEHFSDGLTDELIGTLSKVPGLKVTGHTSAFALKGRGLTVRTIADTLAVASVLEGSVRRVGDRLKVTVQLVSANDNGVVWSEAYDRKLKDVFAVQEEIARAIVGALSPTLRARWRRSGLQPRDLATYELYLEGRYFLGRRTSGDLRRAAGYFEQAVARDPGYAQAYAGLADARVLLVLLADGPPREDVPVARAAAATAIRSTQRSPKLMPPSATSARRSTGTRMEPTGNLRWRSHWTRATRPRDCTAASTSSIADDSTK